MTHPAALFCVCEWYWYYVLCHVVIQPLFLLPPDHCESLLARSFVHWTLKLYAMYQSTNAKNLGICIVIHPS
jgi:hypothetical protein